MILAQWFWPHRLELAVRPFVVQPAEKRRAAEGYPFQPPAGDQRRAEALRQALRLQLRQQATLTLVADEVAQVAERIAPYQTRRDTDYTS